MTACIAHYRVSTDRQAQAAWGWTHSAKPSRDSSAPASSSPSSPGSGAAGVTPTGPRRAVLLISHLHRPARNVAFIANLMEGSADFIACDILQATRLTIHVLAAVAEHEREMISKRTKAALAEAKRRGTKLGNPRIEEARTRAVAAHHASKPAPEVSALIQGWRQRGWTLRRIAESLRLDPLLECT